MPNIDLSILNQRQTPAFYASSLATRPAFGFAGRIFIDTDTPSTGLYRDTGSAWVQIADPGAGSTGTLQQVTTNGNTTTQGITITAGGLSSNIVTIAANGLSSTANYIGGTMAIDDNWKIYGTGSTQDEGELVFQVGENGFPYGSLGERFRFTYDASASGTAKDVFIVDYDLSYFNTSLGINTPTPTAAFDVHSTVSTIAQLNQTVATNNSLLAFQNNNAGLWRIGNFYNAGANDFGVFDVIGSIQPVTIKKTTGQVFIGASTTSSGLFVVNSATSDNHIVAIGANAPSIRVRTSGTAPTYQFGLGIATATNNFIQGAVNGDFCIFSSGSTTSPILFGLNNAGTVIEAARISTSRNFLIGTITDTGQKLQVNGTALFSANVAINGSSLDINPSSGSPNITLRSGNTFRGYIEGNASGGLSFGAGASANIYQTITSGGNILIGTTTDAGYKLGVNGNGYFVGDTETLRLYTTNSAGYTSLKILNDLVSTSRMFEIKYYGSSSVQGESAEIGTIGGAPINFITTNTRRFTIKASGVLNIASIPTSAAGLVSGDIYSNLGILTIVP